MYVEQSVVPRAARCIVLLAMANGKLHVCIGLLPLSSCWLSLWLQTLSKALATAKETLARSLLK